MVRRRRFYRLPQTVLPSTVDGTTVYRRRYYSLPQTVQPSTVDGTTVYRRRFYRLPQTVLQSTVDGTTVYRRRYYRLPQTVLPSTVDGTTVYRRRQYRHITRNCRRYNHVYSGFCRRQYSVHCSLVQTVLPSMVDGTTVYLRLQYRSTKTVAPCNIPQTLLPFTVDGRTVYRRRQYRLPQMVVHLPCTVLPPRRTELQAVQQCILCLVQTVLQSKQGLHRRVYWLRITVLPSTEEISLNEYRLRRYYWAVISVFDMPNRILLFLLSSKITTANR